MTKKVYFISDIHLNSHYSEAEDLKKRYLIDFLQEVKKNRGTLYIVGDMFDFWFEYKYTIPRYFFKTLRHLQEIVEAGCEVHIMSGNHDYWFESFFPEELGITVHLEPVSIEIGGKAFFITHADGILKKDRGYRLMKKVLRNRFVVACFRLLHPDLAYGIAKIISGKSRYRTLRDPDMIEKERKELIEYGRQKIQEGYQFVVTGHFHLPLEYRHKTAKMINLGDWIRYFTFGYFDGKELSLRYWKQDSLKSSQ
ncbi:MAG TPA: UDP-2,3-diacylglucosamine hydrolase [Candidatus Marinimicrobia bacterium]|nr:UDP-2,3-diacylglucosamine hydrolase [Candidatus Neomarinimicrobiota bacterium]